MVTEDFLVQIFDIKNEIDLPVVAFTTKTPEQILKTFYFAMQNEIPVQFPKYYEPLSEKYKNIEACYIKDIRLSFGSKENYNAIIFEVECY